jgi:hypothetical protein
MFLIKAKNTSFFQEAKTLDEALKSAIAASKSSPGYTFYIWKAIKEVVVTIPEPQVADLG